MTRFERFNRAPRWLPASLRNRLFGLLPASQQAKAWDELAAAAAAEHERERIAAECDMSTIGQGVRDELRRLEGRWPS